MVTRGLVFRMNQLNSPKRSLKLNPNMAIQVMIATWLQKSQI